MTIALNHIGIACNDVEGVKKLLALLGFGVDRTQAVPEQGVITHFLPLSAPQGHLELLEVTDPQGTVAKFIAKRGPGIHHLSFTVERGRLDGLCAKITSAGYRLTYDAPRDGAGGMRINFIHPASAGGILIELMEPRF